MTLRYQLAGLEVDADDRIIRAGDQQLSLQRRPMDLLLLLLEHHDRVVSRELLLERVWGGRVVTDAVVDQAVLKVRRALASLGGEGLVQTAHGVGYRIAVPVTVVEAAARTSAVLRCLLAVPQGADGAAAITAAGGIPLPSDGPALFEWNSADDCLQAALRLVDASQGKIAAAIHVPPPLADDSGDARDIVEALVSAAPPGQILLSASAFEWCRHRPAEAPAGRWRWVAHGPFRAEGSDAVISVYGLLPPGRQPAAQPQESSKLRRTHGDDTILGWRAGEGLEIPGLSGWLLAHQLGEGGFGETWLGHHAESGERRAFKFCYRAEHLRSLRREVSVIERLEERLGARADIAGILDWNLDQPPYYIATEYTEQGDLEAWAEAGGGLQHLPLPIRLRLVAQVAEAAAAAHSAGVLHKDIKPANVLIRMDGAEPRAVLTDFGIGLLTAEQLVRSQDTARMTGASGTGGSSSSGTTIYMAPEVLEGRAPGAAADVYAIGVLLYQVAVGDFRRVLAPGWERDVGDPVLRADIAEMVDGDPARRIAEAQVVSERLMRLPQRREEFESLRVLRERLERERRRRRVLMPALIGVSLFAVVVTYQGFRLHQAAGEAKRQALIAAERAATAEATRSFLVELFESTDPLAGESADFSARALLDRGSARVTKQLADQPKVLADMLDALGAIYKNLGQHEQAQRQLEHALQIREARLPADAGTLADTLFRLGDLAYQRGAFAAGEGYLRRAITLQEALGDAALGDLAWSRYKLSHILRRQGRAAEARAEAVAALRLAETSGATSQAQLGRMQSALASVLWLEGRLVEAREQFMLAIETTAAASGAGSADSAAVLAKAAAVLGELEAWEEQERVARQALEIDLRLLGEEHLYVGEIKALLAAALTGQDRYDEAEVLVLEAIGVLERTVGEHPSLASALTAYARMKRYQGDLDAAHELVERGLTIRLNRLGPDHQEVALSQFEQAQLLLAQDRVEAASAALRAAEGIATRSSAPGHWLPHALAATQGFVELRQGRAERSHALASASAPVLAERLGAQHSLALTCRLVESLAASQLSSNPGSLAEADTALGSLLESLERTPGTGPLLAFARQSLLAQTP